MRKTRNKPIMTKKVKTVSIKQRFISRIKGTARKLSDFRPKDENDYYSFGRILVSRKFAVFAIIVVGFLIFLYYAKVSNIRLFNQDGDGIRVYDYDAVALRFISGNVKIRSAAGDIAYVGKVSDGMANGRGRLYYPDGTIMYDGEFKDNLYDGTGNLYYSDGTIQYKGSFKAGKYEGVGDQYYPTGMIEYDGEFFDGLANGNGTSYRENGSRFYSGEFRNGYPDGENSYYDGSDNLIYTGIYSKGRPNFSEILGDDAKEIATKYMGSKKIYYNDDFFMVNMEGINAYYAGKAVGNTISDSVVADSIYVMEPDCLIGGEVCYSIDDVKRKLGNPDYEGNTDLNVAEAICVSENAVVSDMLDSSPNVTCETQIDDVYHVLSMHGDKETLGVYIYMFEDGANGIQYTFYCKDRNDNYFAMYLIQNCR